MAYPRPRWNAMSIAGEEVYPEQPMEIRVSQLIQRRGPSALAARQEAVDTPALQTPAASSLPELPEMSEESDEVPVPDSSVPDLVIEYQEAVDPSAVYSAPAEADEPVRMDVDVVPAPAEAVADVTPPAKKKAAIQVAPESGEDQRRTLEPATRPRHQVQPCFIPPYVLPWKQSQSTVPALPEPLKPEVLPLPAPAVDPGLQQATATFSRLAVLSIPTVTGRGRWRTTVNTTLSLQQRQDVPLMRFSSSSSDEELDTYL
ncbi:predicted GPI-anchored protein 58 [Bufo bufo]|uniref:predicted GPI-anchored protein 58 n=1 Tax=Bufo bufo TaxID=8384 RepID=UPI001ABD9F78|nr:predicted GPI-anchored protein 58 [Bufo bufo]